MRSTLPERAAALRARRLLAAALCGALVSATLPAAASREDAGTRRFGTRDYFAGVLLGEGPVADLFPEVWANPQYLEAIEQLKPGQRDLARVARLRLLAEIEARHPALLSEFAESLSSGDPVRVDRALRKGAAAMMETAAAVRGVDPQAAHRAGPGGDCVIVVVYRLAFAISELAAAVNVAAAINVAVAVNAFTYMNIHTQEEVAPNASLRQEMYVALIVERLTAESLSM
jgi:SdpC family antimicrobial peptide